MNDKSFIIILILIGAAGVIAYKAMTFNSTPIAWRTPAE